MIADVGILAFEVGYVAVVACGLKALTFAARRVASWNVKRGLRKLASATEPPPATRPIEALDYRTNAASAPEPITPRPGFVERLRAERAARYVRRLEERANLEG